MARTPEPWNMRPAAGVIAHPPAYESYPRPDGIALACLMPERCSMVVMLGMRNRQRLEPAAFASALGVRLLRAEWAEGETAVCAALTLAHRIPTAQLRAAVGAWAGEHGWRVTIAPLSGPT